MGSDPIFREVTDTISHSSPAIVLRARVYGESDKIVTFLTRDFGKLSAIAKGALRSKRRFVNSLETFTHVRLGFRMRPQTELGFVESTEIVRPVRNLTRDLERYAYSTYVLEVVDCMVEGREAEPAVFDLADELLCEIDTSHPRLLSPDWLRYFETRLLALSGFEPRLETCSRCAAAAPTSANGLRFNPRNGTLLCGSCSDGTGMPVSAQAISSILHLRHHRPDTTLEGALATEVRVLLQTAIAHHVRRPLRAPAVLRDILGT